MVIHDPSAPVAVGAEAAVWELGHSSRQPAQPVPAHRPGWRPPRSIDSRTVRTVSFDWRVPARTVRALPIWTEATIIVAAAHRPAGQGDWANADEWLPESFSAATDEDVLTEPRDRNAASLARLGYLAEWVGREEIADEVADLLPERLPVSFFGPRDRRDRWSERWRLYDALLPAS
jgi:hypothetical protein